MSKLKFTQMQQSAINHEHGPALVIAGPGSGKTTVIISRLLRLTEKYPEARILSLTFSTAAAKEMESRFSSLVAKSSLSPFQKASVLERTEFSTVHALAYSVIRCSERFINAKVIGTREKISCIGMLHEEINGEILPYSDCDTVVSFIGRIRSNPSQKEKLLKNIQVKNFEKICDGYRDYKESNRLIDFEDMVSEAVCLLEKDRDIRNKFCDSYDFIQADEAQDLTSEQFRFIRLLSSSENIIAVGDDDQSIYGFRGASPDCMKSFSESATGCVTYSLSENHRCGKSIVSLSSKIVGINQNRFDKNLLSSLKTNGEINLLHVKDSYALGRFLASDISEGTTGILYRNNRNALAVISELIDARIPFTVNDSISCDISGYLEMFSVRCIRECLSPRGYIRNFGISEIRNMMLKSNSLYRKDKDNIALAIDLILLLSKKCKTAKEFQKAAALLFKTAEEGSYLLTEKPHVFLSTIHSSKGLEYDNVYLIGLNKDEFPGKSSAEGSLLCEERRLFYVGITRAKSRLNIIYSEYYSGEKAEESILFREALKAQTGRL